MSKESEFDIPLEHIELLLEVIEDELDSKRPSDSIDEISKMVFINFICYIIKPLLHFLKESLVKIYDFLGRCSPEVRLQK